MNEEQLKAIADEADLVVDGYAFTTCEDGFIRVLNLRAPHRAVVFSTAHEMVETSMDDIEVGIVREYLERNLEFLTA